MSTDQAWQEIEGLVEEIDALAQSDLPVRDFYAELLTRAVRALAAVGGAVWVCDRDRLQLQYQIQFEAAGLDQSPAHREAHQRLLLDVLDQGQVKAAPPRSGSLSDSPENPTEHLLVLGPVLIDHEPVAVIEILQRGDSSPAAYRGFMQLMEVLCQVATDYHRHRQLQDLQDRQSRWREFEQFTQQIHSNLDLDEVSYALVNEGRRTIGCERVSLLLMRGKKCRAKAVSGSDRVNRRSNVVRRLERLGETVAAIDEPFWYEGDADRLPPQLETPLDAYLDESHARTMAIVPLKRENSSSDSSRRSKLIGVLVAERFDATQRDESFRGRVETVARHGAGALDNALMLYHLPLKSFLLPLGRMRRWLRGHRIMIALGVLLILAAAVTAICLIEADFKIEAAGQLRPAVRRHVFAPRDSIVEQLNVQRQAAEISSDKILLQLRDAELEYEKTRVQGELDTTRKRLETLRITSQELDSDLTQETRKLRIDAEIEELTVAIAGMKQQLQEIASQEEQLSVKSSIGGKILTWNYSDLLQSRPVRQGQSLLTVADTEGEWILEVQVPDKHISYVLDARRELGDELEVTFLLKSDPQTTYRGVVKKVALASQLDEQGESSVLVTVGFALDQEIPRLRPGASVIAKIHCGRRSLGYVWLHDLIEAVRTRILF